MIKVKDVLKYLEQRFPYELAADFDLGKIGLTIGNPENLITGILCTLDLTDEVIDEAVSKNCNLIISHHPFLFSGITKVLYSDDKGSIIYKMIKNDISLIAMHTNMDLGIGGVGDSLAELFELQDSNINANDKDTYIRYGNIEEVTLEELAQKTKRIFGLGGVRFVGDKNTKIKKIAILGGSGGQEREILNAKRNNCQCYITGEIKHHVGIFAKFNNVCLIEVNHGIEKVVFNKLAKDIQELFGVSTYISEYNTDLFEFI